MAGHRDRFLADALHQAAVAHEDVGPMVAEVVAELGVQDALGQRKADRVGDALAERAGRRLDAVGVLVFGMAGGLAVDLAEPLQLVEGHVLVAGQIEQAVQQHRGMAVRQHEAVAVEPMRIGRIELHEIPEQHGRDVGHAHRRAGMAALGLLHGIHRKKADAVGHVPQMLVAGLGNRLDGRSRRRRQPWLIGSLFAGSIGYRSCVSRLRDQDFKAEGLGFVPARPTYPTSRDLL